MRGQSNGDTQLWRAALLAVDHQMLDTHSADVDGGLFIRKGQRMERVA
jgi:hypothetical protein